MPRGRMLRGRILTKYSVLNDRMLTKQYVMTRMLRDHSSQKACMLTSPCEWSYAEESFSVGLYVVESAKRTVSLTVCGGFLGVFVGVEILSITCELLVC